MSREFLNSEGQQITRYCGENGIPKFSIVCVIDKLSLEQLESLFELIAHVLSDEHAKI